MQIQHRYDRSGAKLLFVVSQHKGPDRHWALQMEAMQRYQQETIQKQLLAQQLMLQQQVSLPSEWRASLY